MKQKNMNISKLKTLIDKEYKSASLANIYSSIIISSNKDILVLSYIVDLLEKDYTHIIQEINYPNFISDIKNLVYKIEEISAFMTYHDAIYGHLKKSEIKTDTILDRINTLYATVCYNEEILKKFKSTLKNTNNSEEKEILSLWIKNVFGVENKKLQKNQSAILELIESFNRNIDNANNNLHNQIFISEDKKYLLKGMSIEQLNMAKANSEVSEKKDGYLFTPESWHIRSALKSLYNRDMRKLFFEKFYSINSSKKIYNNNEDILFELLKKKSRIAAMNGKKNYAELALQNFAISSVEDINSYLNRVIEYIEPKYQEIIKDLESLAKKDFINKLEPWDIQYYLAKKFNDKSFKTFKNYFLLDKTLPKIMDYLAKEFNVDIKFINKNNNNYQYEVTNNDKKTILILNTNTVNDVSQRQNYAVKICENNRQNGINNKGLIFIAYAFEDTKKDKSLSQDDVGTLIHELGHAFHYILTDNTDPKYAESKTSWDLIELPSQYLESLVFDVDFMHELSEDKNGNKISKEFLLRNNENEEQKLYFNTFIEASRGALLLEMYAGFSYGKKNNYAKKIKDLVYKTGIVYNPFRDTMLTSSEHNYDYGPSRYVYIYSAQIAFYLKEYFNKIEQADMRKIYEDVFCANKHRNIKDSLETLVDLKNVPMAHYFKRT